MDEKARFVVGIDVGTSSIRAVMGSVGSDGVISVVGYGESASEGMRRGSVKELTLPAKAIDECLAQVESMSGLKVSDAVVGISSTSLNSVKIDGMIAVGVADHEINNEDLDRIEDAAIAGKIPANRQVLDLAPYEYILDGQGGIREPLGMKGARLEMRASVVSVLLPDYENLQKIFNNIQVNATIYPTAMAAADAVLTPRQKENGVGLVNIGGSTTSVVVYDEGELQYLGVVPIGSNDITKDLATVLATVPEIAEEIKVRFATCRFGEPGKDITIKRGHDEYVFSRAEIDEVVEARLEEIFEGVRKQLKNAGYDKRLPEGIVLTGGGAKLREIENYARTQVELAVRIGKPSGLTGVSDNVLKPEYAAAVGLMMLDEGRQVTASKKHFGGKKGKSAGGFLKNIFKLFK